MRLAREPGRSSLGFTLVELLVVLGFILVALSLLIPAISRAREGARKGQCAANLHQLYMANLLYAADHGRYVAAASDIQSGNLMRWHGLRKSMSDPFEGERGPLAPYLGADDRIRHCPSLSGIRRDAAANAFEASCGGYGYNSAGVGSEVYVYGYNKKGSAQGMKLDHIQHASATLMFADTAFPQPYFRPKYLVEYSFAEPYYFVRYDRPEESGFRASPSIHFRHNGTANVVWCDGHVSSEALRTHAGSDFTRYKIGWFGGPNNEFFDPF